MDAGYVRETGAASEIGTCQQITPGRAQGAPTETKIDASDGFIRYGGSWYDYDPGGFYNGTGHEANVGGRTAELTITGTTVKVYGAHRELPMHVPSPGPPPHDGPWQSDVTRHDWLDVRGSCPCADPGVFLALAGAGPCAREQRHGLAVRCGQRAVQRARTSCRGDDRPVRRRRHAAASPRSSPRKPAAAQAWVSWSDQPTAT